MSQGIIGFKMKVVMASNVYYFGPVRYEVGLCGTSPKGDDSAYAKEQ